MINCRKKQDYRYFLTLVAVSSNFRVFNFKVSTDKFQMKKNLNIAVKVFFLPFGMEERLLTAGVKLQPVKSD
ncbi:hypothetical protein A3Q34_06825 [Colwellia sp. PAMC 20917]|nr:hypothetical protein A3Q34_06825 [Colwellia sp. PAMC 20917]